MQADQVSDWYGMGTPVSLSPEAGFTLRSGQPAYLEVSIDPAAHGDAGLKPIKRAVLLKTAQGEELRFEFTANVVR